MNNNLINFIIKQKGFYYYNHNDSFIVELPWLNQTKILIRDIETADFLTNKIPIKYEESFIIPTKQPTKKLTFTKEESSFFRNFLKDIIKRGGDFQETYTMQFLYYNNNTKELFSFNNQNLIRYKKETNTENNFYFIVPLISGNFDLYFDKDENYFIYDYQDFVIYYKNNYILHFDLNFASDFEIDFLDFKTGEEIENSYGKKFLNIDQKYINNLYYQKDIDVFKKALKLKNIQSMEIKKQY